MLHPSPPLPPVCGPIVTTASILKGLEGLLLRNKMPYLTHWHISFGIALSQSMEWRKDSPAASSNLASVESLGLLSSFLATLDERRVATDDISTTSTLCDNSTEGEDILSSGLVEFWKKRC